MKRIHHKGDKAPNWQGDKRVKRICQYCGKEFEVWGCYIKLGRSKFCSQKCFAKYRDKRIKRICQQCGKEFKVHLYDIKRGGGKFCSMECYRKSQRKRVKQTCKQCGEEFEVCLSTIKQGGGKFCSCKCWNKWRSEHIIGENHPSWQGGISFEPYCAKFNFAFKEYIRDKFGRICFLCPKTEEENGQRLSVHHVNYDKDCICNDNLTCQFVPLCRTCNSKVNYNRKEWEVKIKAMLHNKLNGWYI